MKKIIPLMLSLFVLTNCSKKDADKVAEAQACLDTATTATSLACMDKVSGIESSAAYLVRCGATFIHQGFGSPATLATVAAQLTNSASTTSDTFSVLSLVAFTANGTNLTDVVAQTANYDDSTTNFTYCKQAASKGLLFLSAISRIGTAFVKAGADNQAQPGCNPAGGMAGVIPCLVTGTLAAVPNTIYDSLGDVIRTTYQYNCIGNTSSSSQVFCGQFKSAVDNSDGTNSDVFCEFLKLYSGGAIGPCT